MFRMNVVRSLGVLAIVVGTLVATTSTASAGLFNRASRYSYQRVTYTNNSAASNNSGHGHHYGHDGYHGDHSNCYHPHCVHPVHWDYNALRYVRVIYFSSTFSAWFESDAMVHPYAAVLGNSAIVLVPRVGYVRGWVVAVHSMPPMNSPYKASAETAPKTGTTNNQQQMMNSGSQPGQYAQQANSQANQVVSTPARISVKGHERVWTNKAGTRTAKAELLQIRENSILVRDSSGQIVEQPFENLSDSDVAFVKSGAAAPSRLAAK